MSEHLTLIMEYILEEECADICKNGIFNCLSCNCSEDCYTKAKTRCNEEFNSLVAESINYGGYESAEEFWNELLE